MFYNTGFNKGIEDTINTLNDICFIDEFNKVMTKEILNYVCNYKITNTLLKLNVLLKNK